jgi:hypothetical protein
MKQQEPTAAARTWAKQVRELYEALLESGFTEGQAVVVLGVMLVTMGGQLV